MDSMKGKEELEPVFNDSEWDTTSVMGLGKLLSETIHTCIHNSIIKLTQKGYTEEDSKHAILQSGPFYGTAGKLESNIVERAFIYLESSNEHNTSSSNYKFHDLKKLVDFMTLEMVTMVRDMKLPAVTPRKTGPTMTVSEAMWRLLMCDLNVHKAMEIDLDLDDTETASESESESEFKNQETVPSREMCTCNKKCSVVTHQRDDDVRRKVSMLVDQRPHKVNARGLKKKLSNLREMTSVNKRLSSSGKDKSICLEVKLTDAKPKIHSMKMEDDHLNNNKKEIESDEKGEDMNVVECEKAILRVESVAQTEVLKQELQGWGDWANSKVMNVTNRLSKHREEVSLLKAEKEQAMKDNADLEGSTSKRLLQRTLSLNSANNELNHAASDILKLRTQQTALKEDLVLESNRSLVESKRLEQQLIKEDEALKKSQSFGPEKAALEEELKAIRRQIVQKQKEREKAKSLLTETQIRVSKEEKEAAKVVNEAESIKNERERVEGLAMAEYEMMKEKRKEELKKNEIEKKRIEYEISAIKLEAESKKIAAMQKSMNMNMDSSKRLDVFKNISEKKKSKKKKKKDKECVMCLNEEMSVVFAPCGHKVLCKSCNVKHGEMMNECPACRSPIEKRIDTRSAKC